MGVVKKVFSNLRKSFTLGLSFSLRLGNRTSHMPVAPQNSFLLPLKNVSGSPMSRLFAIPDFVSAVSMKNRSRVEIRAGEGSGIYINCAFERPLWFFRRPREREGW